MTSPLIIDIEPHLVMAGGPRYATDPVWVRDAIRAAKLALVPPSLRASRAGWTTTDGAVYCAPDGHAYSVTLRVRTHGLVRVRVDGAPGYGRHGAMVRARGCVPRAVCIECTCVPDELVDIGGAVRAYCMGEPIYLVATTCPAAGPSSLTHATRDYYAWTERAQYVDDVVRAARTRRGGVRTEMLETDVAPGAQWSRVMRLRGGAA